MTHYHCKDCGFSAETADNVEECPTCGAPRYSEYRTPYGVYVEFKETMEDRFKEFRNFIEFDAAWDKLEEAARQARALGLGEFVDSIFPQYNSCSTQQVKLALSIITEKINGNTTT